MTITDTRTRWLALIVLCMGSLMIVLGGAAVLLTLFLGIEARVRSPLVPLGLFRLRNVATANVVGVLWAAAMFAWFFLSALYLQLVLGYSPLQVGLAFLPSNVIMAIFSIGLSAKLVMRYGIRAPLATGLQPDREDRHDHVRKQEG